MLEILKKLQKNIAWTPKLDYLFWGSYAFALKNRYKMWLVCGYFKILFGYFGYFQKQIWLFFHILIWQPWYSYFSWDLFYLISVTCLPSES